MTAVASGRTEIHDVQGGGGLRLHVREWGNADGLPILFIHGWSQNHLCWAKQYESPLADEFRLVAYDLRGHGMSDAPLAPEHYTDGELWADDVAAIVERLGLERPVLVGWSYGAFVICDYVRAHGQDRIGAINLVEGVVKMGEAAFGTFIGPGFLDHFADATADDLPTNIRSMRSFVDACATEPLSAEEFETALSWNIVVPARIRAISLRARSTTTTCCRPSACHYWLHRAARTPSCSLRWQSTSSRSARPPRRPGTTASATCRTCRSRSGSTASWPSSPGACRTSS
jgi:non-heme chloroperoxidase